MSDNDFQWSLNFNKGILYSWKIMKFAKQISLSLKMKLETWKLPVWRASGVNGLIILYIESVSLYLYVTCIRWTISFCNTNIIFKIKSRNTFAANLSVFICHYRSICSEIKAASQISWYFDASRVLLIFSTLSRLTICIEIEEEKPIFYQK